MLYREPATGVEALLDAGHLTDIRIGEVTALACQHLARRGAQRSGLIGAGLQARTKLDAVLTVAEISDVRVWDPRGPELARFVAAARQRHPDVRITAATSARDALEGAGIVVAVICSVALVVEDDWVLPGLTICSIAGHTPDAAEIAPSVDARASRIVVDTRRGALAGAADIQGPIEAGLIPVDAVAEIGEICWGEQAVARGMTS
jgi:ornithine cyclodeaminase